MIFGAVVDTHAAIWYLFDDLRLSRKVRAWMEEMAAGSQKIAVSSITLAELVYLVEKGRLGPEAYEVMKSALSDPDHVLVEATVNEWWNPCGRFPVQKFPICQTAS